MPRIPAVVEAGDPTRRRRVRVLVVDDDALNRRAAEALLLHSNVALVTVIGVADGAAALALVATEPFDLVLLDDRMPAPDGPAVAAALRRQEAAAGTRRIAVIGVTASVLPEDTERLIAAGMDAVVAKPLLAEELEGALRRWLPGGR